ncbi:hypothetical protein [Actinokineospora sp. NBRC 105648]|uniref:hypothetical protein n=1 Tax=Actinokineospora sp. NBRC 105648 TaxID=3032206 RepID=UPI0024A585DC|nr:hypothetical protein [Actinokineospora sp. NBRC 105648]GLZ38329.1 hypothetical protein Acsp05_19530 [Actinokineospora sp. NBRC 105648]
MSGYTTDPAELAGTASLLRSTADALTESTVDESLPAHTGPPRLAESVAAFSAQARTVIATSAAVLADTATLVAAAGADYTETDSATAQVLRALVE